MSEVLIIGAGMGGLATAALLAKDGHSVTILEKNTSIGGRARTWQSEGFTFDMGPSWYQMPEAFDHFFARFGKKPEDYFELVKLDPQYKVFFNNAAPIEMSADHHRNMALFEKLEPGVTPRIEKYLKHAGEQYDLSVQHVLYRNYDSMRDFFNTDMMKIGMKFNVLENLQQTVEKVTKHPHIQKILMYTVLFLGGSPTKTPSLFSLMSYLDMKLGTFYPMGGIGAVVAALESLCKEHGVTILTGKNVTKIEVESGVAKKVHTTTGLYHADIVISNADYPFTETTLLDAKYTTYPASYWAKKTIAPSAFIMYLGIKGQMQSLAHHTLFLDDDWMTFFNSLFNGSEWPENPSYYVSCTSKTDPSVAPKGHDNLFVTVQVAPDVPDTPAQRERFAKKIISHMERLTGESIADRIVLKRYFSPTDFKTDYNAYKGTAIGLSNTLLQSAYFRPHNRSKKVSNLYYVGQYTNPGVGMPMCMISAELVADRIKNAV